MKILMIAAILSIGLSASAAPEVFGPRDIDIKLGELATMPLGLKVSHTPEAVQPTFSGPSGNEWLHQTTVVSEVGPVKIVEYGYFVERNGNWYHAAGTVEGYEANDFAERFGCPDAKLIPGKAYTYKWNRSLKDNQPEQSAKWYFIGVDAEGNRVKGEALVILQGGFNGC